MTKQKAYLIQMSPGSVRGLDELNMALGRGWRVASATPLGGAASGATSDAQIYVGCLVVVERDERRSAAFIETAEEEDIVDELLEGDGADADVDTDL